MTMNALTPIEFHGDLLWTAETDGMAFVAVKPICERLGIAWRKQWERIKRDTILAEGVTMMVIPSAGGPQQTTLLRLDLLNGWLFGIDYGRVKDETTRQLVLTYKRECYRALFEHFMGAARPAPDAAPVETDAPSDIGPLSDLSARARLVEIAERLSGKAAARALWRRLGLPWVDEMGQPAGERAVEADDAVARFALEGIERVRGVVTPAAMLWPAFCLFCGRHDLVVPPRQSFFTRFGQLGFPKVKTGGRVVYHNIRPADTTARPADREGV